MIIILFMNIMLILAIECFETALLSIQLQVTAANITDIATNDQICDDNILRISFACLYYCKAISSEFFLPADMDTTKLQKSFSNEIFYLDRSLLQYSLSKTRIRMCSTWLSSYFKNTKEQGPPSKFFSRNQQF